jgi:fatty acid desaturase
VWLGGAAILLVPMPLFRSGHLQHHAAVNQPGRDPDLWVARARPMTRLLACFSFVPRYYWNFARGVVPPPSRTEERRTISIGFCAMGLFVAAMIYSGHGWMIAWLWIGPGILTGGILALCFAWLPHAPPFVVVVVNRRVDRTRRGRDDDVIERCSRSSW